MIRLRNVSKKFPTPSGEFIAVAPTSLDVQKGDIYGIIGFSGAGKSTLLRLINLLELPSSGSVVVNNLELTKLPKHELRTTRQSIGMIFQHFHLLHNRTVSQNVEFALEVAGVPKAERGERVQECLSIVGLLEKADQYPAKLSGGQKQRVAIARALANKPKVLLCDEPTSALDPKTTGTILSFLREINHRFGVTIIIVTHEMAVVQEICNKVAVMENGKIMEEIDLQQASIRPQTEIGQLLLYDQRQGKGIAAHV